MGSKWWKLVAGVYKWIETSIANPMPVQIVDGVDNTGGFFDPDGLAHTYTYDASGNLQTDAVTDGTNTWTKTYTWTSGRLTAESQWVKS